MLNKVIVDLEKAEKSLKEKLSYREWLDVYTFLANCEEYEEEK